MLRFLSVEEFANLMVGDKPGYWEVPASIRNLGKAIVVLDSAVKRLEDILQKFPQLSNVVYQRLLKLVKTKIKGYSVTVTEEHAEKFRKILSTRAAKTKKDRIRYLLKALRDLGYELSLERLQEYIAELYEVSPYVVQHIVKALKLFIKHVIRDPNLYLVFKTLKVEPEPRDIPTLDDIRSVTRATE